jgi:hypothetical protein
MGSHTKDLDESTATEVKDLLAMLYKMAPSEEEVNSPQEIARSECRWCSDTSFWTTLVSTEINIFHQKVLSPNAVFGERYHALHMADFVKDL